MEPVRGGSGLLCELLGRGKDAQGARLNRVRATGRGDGSSLPRGIGGPTPQSVTCMPIFAMRPTRQEGFRHLPP